jgi:hypothetical protein
LSFIETILIALGLLPSKELATSMHRSKTLTVMVIVGIMLFAGFAFFLFKMAGVS